MSDWLESLLKKTISILFGFETCTGFHYLVFNFYQINRDGEIRTRDRLVIKALISY